MYTVRWLIAFLIVALAVASTATALLQGAGIGWASSTIFGAVIGVIASYGLIFTAWHLYMRICRGAPFQVGDQVEVIDGPLQGKKAEVHKLCEGRCSVVAKLINHSDSSEIHVLDWIQIRRVDCQKDDTSI
jgi:hypothetical protein